MTTLLNGSSSFLQDKSFDDFEYLTASTTDYRDYQQQQKRQCLHFFSVANDLILFHSADEDEMHTILDVFEFWPDWAIENIVSCP